MRFRIFLPLLFSLNFVSPASSQSQTNHQGEIDPVKEKSQLVVAVPEPTPRAVRFYQSGNILWAIWTVWSLAAPALLLVTGFSARLRNFSHKPGRNWFLANVIFFSALAVVLFLLNLPLEFFGGFLRLHWFGLSNQTFADWIGDWAKLLGVSALGAVCIAWFPFWIIRKSPQRWWLISSVAAVPTILIFFLILPLWIDPLFNKFGPMKNKTLEQKILSLASRANIEGSRVFEVNKSEETKAVNAYVTGFLGTKRIVLWDTTLAKLNEDELLAVVGHEMGHYVLGHMTQIIIGSCFAVLVGLFFIHETASRLIRRFKNRLGFSELSDVAAAPLFILLFQIALLILMPLFMAVSRRNEHEADRFGLELTRNNFAAASAFVKIQQENLAMPYHGTFFKLWRGSHPDLGDRIIFCNEYKPWLTNAPMKYENLFKPRP